MVSAISLTPSEAGYVLGQSATAINKAVDTGVICVRKSRVGRVTHRMLGAAELRFLRLADEFAGDLTPAGRRRLYEAVRELPTDKHELTLGEVVMDFRRIDKDLTARIERLDRLRRQVDQHTGKDEPVIRGTDVPVHAVASLARGQSIEEILEDYPGLNREQVEAAIEYAGVYPKKGRRYPSRSFKRMMADLATHEVEMEGLDEGPRMIGA
jgi:uncharacterized protein (DUF433 family)